MFVHRKIILPPENSKSSNSESVPISSNATAVSTSSSSTSAQELPAKEVQTGAANAKVQQELSEKNKLFIGNVPYKCTTEKLKEMLEYFGPLVKLHVPVGESLEGEAPHHRGFAFATFRDSKHARVRSPISTAVSSWYIKVFWRSFLPIYLRFSGTVLCLCLLICYHRADILTCNQLILM